MVTVCYASSDEDSLSSIGECPISDNRFSSSIIIGIERSFCVVDSVSTTFKTCQFSVFNFELG